MTIVINSVPFRPFRPERSVPFKNQGQNGVVFVPVLIPVRSGQIPVRTPQFRSWRSVPALKSFFFCFFFKLVIFFPSNFKIMFV